MKTDQFSLELRKLCLQMVYTAKASHIGSAYSIADIVSILYNEIMVFDPQDPNFSDRDRLILSKGHACTAIYAALGLSGFFEVSELKTYGENESIFMNHISHKVPGVEFSTGSLGHGLPFAVGKALHAKKNNKNWRVFTILSDGEMDEGTIWEALMFSSHHNLNNLTFIIDYNKLQSLDSVSNTLNLEPLSEKLAAFGSRVETIDGHDLAQLRDAFKRPTKNQNGPKAVIANTVKGKGVSFMENKVEWHYRSPNEEQFNLAMGELSCAR